MSFCVNCGKELIEGGDFCPFCGTKAKEVIEAEELLFPPAPQIEDVQPVNLARKTFAYCAMLGIFAIGAIVLIALLSGAIRYVFSDKTPRTETTSETQTAQPSLPSQNTSTTSSPSPTDNRYHLSTTIQLHDNNTNYNVCVNEAYSTKPTWGPSVVYMYCVVENTGTANGFFSNGEFTLYGDNVQLNPTMTFILDNSDNMKDFYGGELPPGRRFEGYLVYECDPAQYEHLELDVANGAAVYQVK